jgi:hypothetical protein
MGQKASSLACQATGQHTLRKGVPQVRAAKDLFDMCPQLFSGVRQDCVGVFQVGTRQGTDGSTRNMSRGRGTGVRGQPEPFAADVTIPVPRRHRVCGCKADTKPTCPRLAWVLWEAAIAAANGLTFDQALASITINAAKLIGVGDRVGSLEPGKDGDVALYDGDPFEDTTHCVGTVVDGKVVSSGKF